MPSLHKRSDSIVPSFRAKVPADVVDKLRQGRKLVIAFPASDTDPAWTSEITIKTHAKVSLRSRDSSTARLRASLAAAQLERLYASIRQGPRRLTHEQIVALAGKVYDHFVERYNADPGDAERWARFDAWDRAVAEGRVFFCPMLDHSSARDAMDPFGSWTMAEIDAADERLLAEDRKEARENRYGNLADWVCTNEAIELAADQRDHLLLEIERAIVDLAARMRPAAESDYTPDPRANRFPELKRKSSSNVVSLWKLVERWEAEKSKRRKTIAEYRANMKLFVAFLGHDDALRITPQDVVRWKDHLLDSGIDPRTVAEQKLASLKAILNLAAANHRIPNNPAKGITVQWDRGSRKMLGFSDEEAVTILKAALSAKRPCIRWIPWLCALTGARISEMAQLRKEDVALVRGVWTLHLRKEAGSLKNGPSERDVPIHPAIIEQGFLAYVGSRQDGPLFGDLRRRKKGASSGVAKSIVTDVAEWVHTLGLKVGRKLYRKDPNHGWRHRFSDLSRIYGLDFEKREAILGHRLPGEAGTYGTMAGLAEEIAKLPNPLSQ